MPYQLYIKHFTYWDLQTLLVKGLYGIIVSTIDTFIYGNHTSHKINRQVGKHFSMQIVKNYSFNKILYSFSQTHKKNMSFSMRLAYLNLNWPDSAKKQTVLLLRALQSLCGSQGHAPYADLTDHLTFALSDLKYTDYTYNSFMSFN